MVAAFPSPGLDVLGTSGKDVRLFSSSKLISASEVNLPSALNTK